MADYTPEQIAAWHQKDRTCSCGGTYHFIESPFEDKNRPPPDFTDCRWSLPASPFRCDSCKQMKRCFLNDAEKQRRAEIYVEAQARWALEDPR